MREEESSLQGKGPAGLPAKGVRLQGSLTKILQSCERTAVKKLKQERRISRVGPDKGGHWEVVKDQQP